MSIRNVCRAAFVAIGWACVALIRVSAADDSQATTEVDDVRPAAASAAEPLARAFSARAAASYLDKTARDWVQTRRCAACHTIPPFLMARPFLPARGQESAEVRAFVERVVIDQLEAEPKLPPDAISAVNVQVATALAINDRLTTGKLHPVTRLALDRIWTRQRDDGSWEWPFRDVPPIKIDEHYGVTLAALGVGMAPDGYAESEAARAGLAKIRRYLIAHPAVSLHQQAMLTWASVHVEQLMLPRERTAVIDKLLAAQRPDGGWSLASLVENVAGQERVTLAITELQSRAGYGKEFLIYVGRGEPYTSSLASDGYATGFAIYVARQSGVPIDDARLARGVVWLKTNQRDSGRWFTPSQGNHTQHYIANAGTAFAVMALSECDALR